MVKVVTAKPEHKVAYEDLAGLIQKHADKVDAEGLLAIASNMVGKLIAMQDQRTMSQDRAMATVAENIEAGNREMMEQLLGSKGSA